MPATKDEAIAAATSITQTRYPNAASVLLAGSYIRGEATDTSDLDVVVVFERLPFAYRETYRALGWLVEAFVHDFETLNYFLESYQPDAAVASLANMIAEGIDIRTQKDKSIFLKQKANRILARGPQLWNATDIERSRYQIADLIDDIRSPYNKDELQATAAQLYPLVANYYLRRRGAWGARGKWIAKRLKSENQKFAAEFDVAFRDLFALQNPDRVIGLAEELLAADGGLSIEHYRDDAPPDWRRADEEVANRS